MLITEKVLMTINNRQIKHYRDLGYVIPKKRNSQVWIKVDDLMKNSHLIVTVKCEKCGELHDIEYLTYHDPYLCQNCSWIKMKKTKEKKIQ